MSIQDIIAKIVAQAEQESAEILSKADAEVASIQEAAQAEAEEKRQFLDTQTQAKIVRAVEKAESLAHMEGKNRILAKKQEILSAILDAVVQKLEKMPAKDYEQLLAQLMKSIDVEDAVLFPAKGKENSTKGAVKLAEKKFRVGDSKEFAGGFLLESDQADYDFSFESLVKQVMKQEIEALVKKEIF